MCWTKLSCLLGVVTQKMPRSTVSYSFLTLRLLCTNAAGAGDGGSNLSHTEGEIKNPGQGPNRGFESIILDVARVLRNANHSNKWKHDIRIPIS